jgi:hypothetical protein
MKHKTTARTARRSIARTQDGGQNGAPIHCQNTKKQFYFMQNTLPANQPAEKIPPALNPPFLNPEKNELRFLVFAFDYPRQGNSGGWSKSAKHKPAPVLAVDRTPDVKSPVRGKRRRRFTAFDLTTTPATLIRRDFSLDDIRTAGGALPEFYFDELGNMRAGENDKVIFYGPSAGQPVKIHTGGGGMS